MVRQQKKWKINLFKDAVIEWVDEYHVKIKRTEIETKCWQMILVDLSTGEIVEILEEGCPDAE